MDFNATADIGIARIFSARVHFPRTKIWWLFFSHHPLLHGHILHILPPTTFLSYLWGCTSPEIQPNFCLISNKNAYKNIFFVTRRGAPATPALSGYAYDCRQTNSNMTTQWKQHAWSSRCSNSSECCVTPAMNTWGYTQMIISITRRSPTVMSKQVEQIFSCRPSSWFRSPPGRTITCSNYVTGCTSSPAH